MLDTVLLEYLKKLADTIDEKADKIERGMLRYAGSARFGVLQECVVHTMIWYIIITLLVSFMLYIFKCDIMI